MVSWALTWGEYKIDFYCQDEAHSSDKWPLKRRRSLLVVEREVAQEKKIVLSYGERGRSSERNSTK